MVLRKERPPCGGESSGNATMSNEQPVTKRQRIESGTNGENSILDINSLPNVSSNNNLNEQCSTDELDNVPSSSSASSSSVALHPLINDIYLTANSSSTTPPATLTTSSTTVLLQNSIDNDLDIFQTNLLKQCLCGVSETILKRPFQNRDSKSVPTTASTVAGTTINSTKRPVILVDWPMEKLLRFLSNFQLLFEVYLKQNKAGSICERIKDVCDALILNENNLMNEIIELSDYNNKYVQYLAGRVMSSFLVIAQDSQSCSDWLKKLVDNLFSFEDLNNFSAKQKITFSLDIFKRIVEWQDVDEHPLDDDESVAGSSSSPEQTFHPPPIENNYFNFYTDSPSTVEHIAHQTDHRRIMAPATNSSSIITPPSRTTASVYNSDELVCHLVHIADYEYFDTTKLKCETVKIIENKWPALLRNMNVLISSQREWSRGESLIITFLELWKSIISVNANLSVNDTHPFHAQLDNFEEMHLNHNLSPTIYKQMLTLFNEALCYGSTLSLQDIIPDETCNLAHRIIKHMKDDSPMGLLYSVPTRHTENPVSLIGYAGQSVMDTMCTQPERLHTEQTQPIADCSIDKTFLQKMVLLVLKSVAVTVREMRSDSSDSSIDSNDYQAYSDLILIEQNMRTVLKKLEVFTKNKLQLHPENHFSKMLVYLFDDQDDFLIEAMVCTLDVTAGFTVRTTAFTENPFAELIRLLNPVYTFLEFLNMTSKSWGLLLDLLVSNETCFLLYLLRFLKYISKDWYWFDQSCQEFGEINGLRDVREEVMGVLHDLRFEISRMVASSTFPYDISPILRLLETCENLHEGNNF